MDGEFSHSLLIHGSIVLLFGLLSGIPFWIAIIRGQSEKNIRAWRVAHATLIACGFLLLVIGLIRPYFTLSPELLTVLRWALITSGYSFTVALVLGAGMSRRALTPGRFGISTILFAAHLIGAVGAVAGTCLSLYGLIR